MPFLRRAFKAGAAGGPSCRVAVLTCTVLFLCFLLFWGMVTGEPLLIPGGQPLTLERPNVNVDWDKVPDRQKNLPKLVYAPNRLFGTVEFRSPIKNLPQWERVMRLYGKKKSLDADFKNSKQSKGWQALKAAAPKMGAVGRLQEVNKFFNRWPYRTDMDVYGLVDYWATPAEFIKNSGDCEDFAIIKMFALVQLGVNAEDMRLVVLKDQIRNIDHAVLAVYLGEEVYILDNVSPLVLSHSKYGHYRPVISVNLFYRWAHVPPSK